MPDTLFIVKISGRSRPKDAAWFGKTLIEFTRANVAGRDLMIAEVPRDSDAVEFARRVPTSYQVMDIDPTAITVEKVAALVPAGDIPPKKSDETLPAPLRSARLYGWSLEDIAGTCENGRPGPTGGRSLVSGLTAAEMALCKPPKDWDSKRGEMWPWEDLLWRGPGLDWKPPGLPAKATKPSDPDAGIDDDPEELVTEVGAVEVAREPGEDGEFGTEDDVVKIRRPRRKTSKAAKKADEGPLDIEDNAILVIYTTDDDILQKAARLLAEMESAAGKKPSINKANYQLRKKGLPTVKADQLAALLRVPVIG